jgi:hypothetical protein
MNAVSHWVWLLSGARWYEAVFTLADALKEWFERCGTGCGGGMGACHEGLHRLNKTNTHGEPFWLMAIRTSEGIKWKGCAVATGQPQRLVE